MRTAATPVANLRRTEFARLDAAGVAYLDYGGAAPYGDSQLRAHLARLARGVFGNPHSMHGSSRESTRLVDVARRMVLDFLDAGDDYAVVFTANASAAIRLVAEAFPFSPSAPLVLTADNHNSVNGVREYARRAGAPVMYLPLADNLRLADPAARLARLNGRGLFAFPAQSNFSGVRHPLSLVFQAQERGYRVLLDAAAFVPSHALSLRACPADFVALSFYKMFGYPTGVGALVARREALAELRRPWFAGGTVEFVSVEPARHRLRAGYEAFEDGTISFLDIAALDAGFALLERAGMDAIAAHTKALARELVVELRALRHPSGAPAIRLYGPEDDADRGGTVAFNVLDRNGKLVPFAIVVLQADAANVHLRGGCFCNPGAAEAALGFDGERLAGAGAGAVRASIGLANTRTDVRRLIAVLRSFARPQRPSLSPDVSGMRNTRSP
jgi:selenocysteine lyase/cysteine desulfurase